MVKSLRTPLALWLMVALAAAAPISLAAAQSEECLDLRAPDAKVTLKGKLTRRVFAGPPSYESIAKGDAEEVAFILKLPHPVCADDGEFIDGSAPFDRVHVKYLSSSGLAELRAAVGRDVIVTGAANGAQTGHDHAPLVVYADEIGLR